MRGLRPVSQLEFSHGLLLQAIRHRYSLVLPQMFEPGVRSEGFNEAPVNGGILEYAPVVRAVSAARARILRKCVQKFVTAIGIDSIFDGYQNRSSIRLDLPRCDRIRPMHRW